MLSNNSQTYFVTGIGTDVGKTIVSAILVETLQADYWKPVQAGDLDHSDTHKVKALVQNTRSVFHPEQYRLSTPMSPHGAAAIDGVEIKVDEMHVPKTSNKLIIEGAGGLMVPLSSDALVVDLAKHLGAPVVLVSQNYLGSINHTLLSYEMLKAKGIPMAGIIFNGETNPSSEEYILSYTGLHCILRVQKEDIISSDIIKKYSQQVNLNGPN